MHRPHPARRRPSRAVALLAAPLLLLVASCGDDDEDDGGSGATLPAGVTAPATAAASPLPTNDAAGVRDELLALAEGAAFDGSSPGSAIIGAWLARYPGLQLSLLADQEADELTLSTFTAFLLAGTGSDDPTLAFEQHFAFAVKDSTGACAGGVAVIPGDEDGTAGDELVPTAFEPVEPPADECTADGASAALRGPAG